MAKRWHHLYPAIVRDVHDPMRSGRIKVECPPVYGVGAAHWSPWCLPSGASHLWSVPLEGDTVWIAFRQGDARYPVYFGRYTTYADASAPTEFRAFSEGPYYDQLRDYADHQNAWDDNDHRKGHDHGAGEFWNPYVHALVFPLGAGLLVDEEPGEQKTTLRDRIGQHLAFLGDPADPVDPHDESRVGGEYDAPDLDDESTLFSEEGLKAKLRLQGRHAQFLEMRVFAEDKEEELELHGANIDGTHGSKLVFSNSALDKRFLLERFIPGYNQSYRAFIDPDDLTSNYQTLYDHQGQALTIHSDDVTPDRWARLENGLGNAFEIRWDDREMDWRDHNGQSIFFNTDETAPNRYIEVKNAPGEKIQIHHDEEFILIEDRNGTMIEWDAEEEVLTIFHHEGDTVVLDGDVIRALHKSGSSAVLKDNEVNLTNGATDTIDLGPSGIDISSAGTVALSGNTITMNASSVAFTAGIVTINGKPVAVNGDSVVTPVGPGTVIGTGN